MRKLGKMGLDWSFSGLVAFLSPVFSPFELANSQQVALRGWRKVMFF
jgi:hypothetical protein